MVRFLTLLQVHELHARTPPQASATAEGLAQEHTQPGPSARYARAMSMQLVALAVLASPELTTLKQVASGSEKILSGPNLLPFPRRTKNTRPTSPEVCARRLCKISVLRASEKKRCTKIKNILTLDAAITDVRWFF